MNTAQYSMGPSEVEGLAPNFGDLYIAVRQQEKRIYTDDELKALPEISPSHIHHKEWQIRKYTSQKLINYIARKKRSLKILEIGSGNGWLSSKLASIENTNVTGLDINEVEILQAKRVFKKSNLEFVCDSFNPEMFFGAKFDIILFAASAQYFPSLAIILQKAFSSLAKKGEIHIMDTPFYNTNEIDGAKQRAKSYFASLGCPEMAACYFYHFFDNLKQFNYRVLLNPHSIINRISKKYPFYWIAVTN